MSDPDLFYEEAAEGADGPQTQLTLDLTMYTGLVELEPGEYNAQIARVNVIQPKEEGKYGSIAVTWEITGPEEFKGASVSDFATLSPKAMKHGLGAAGYIRLLGTLPKAGDTELNLNVAEWVGFQANIVLAITTYQGEERMSVTKVRSFREIQI